MKPSVYLETSIIGYLAMRMSSVLRIAANQQTTRNWWDNHRERFELFVSRYVIDARTATRSRLKSGSFISTAFPCSK